jgi:hypothetical protein
METKFNFKSQVCTSVEQSRRLLALGLKKETADCCYYYYDGEYLIAFAEDAKYPSDIPAWSLHRLLSLYNLHYIEFMNDEEIESVYDIVIDAITQAIEGGYFPKEYLV